MSLIVTLLLVATIVPDVDPVLSLTRNTSVPSVKLSALVVIVNDPLLLEIDTEPLIGVVKSSEFTVPVTPSIVQNNVPLPKFVVVTVAVVLCPSFTEVGERLIA